MSAHRRAWDAAWYGPVLDLRAWLMLRGTLLMLALDAWLLMIERGGRYGAGGFNVAHFAWLDVVQPVPTSGFYVNLVLTCGVLAMLITLGALARWGLIALTLTYTYGWAMSQLDSYQHHVFISWMLLCLCAFPPMKTRDVLREPRQVSAWGYRLLAAITAILYFFTGVSKAEPEWLAGGVLKRINSTGGSLEPLRELVMGLGADEATFWTLSGYGVVAIQWVITALWLSVLVWGEGGGRWVKAGRFLGVLAAAAFHIGAEVMGLRIGWFSWYMLAMTVVAFTPGQWLAWTAQTVLGRAVGLLEGLPPTVSVRERATWAGLTGVAALCFVALGTELDLPDTDTAGLLWALLVLVPAAWALKRGASGRTWAVAAAITLTSLSLSMDTGRARYDFYRFVGGDATRRLELHTALQAYGRANTYAPAGEGRWKKVESVKAKLRVQR